jgi:hypothetical protein
MAAGMLPNDELNALRVLVVHTNFAVGSAIARRLIDASVIALSHAGAVLDGHQQPGAYHLVMLCPYLPADERDALLAKCLASGETAVTELSDSELGSRVLVHRAGNGAADVVAEALALPLADPNGSPDTYADTA